MQHILSPGTWHIGLGSVCVALTAYYSFRLIFLTFLAPTGAFKVTVQHTHDAPPLMALPLILLALGSIFLGYLGKDMMIGLGTDFWGNALFVLPKNLVLLESEYIPQTQKLLPLAATFLGGFLAYLLNYRSIFAEKGYQLKTWLIGPKTIHHVEQALVL